MPDEAEMKGEHAVIVPAAGATGAAVRVEERGVDLMSALHRGARGDEGEPLRHAKDVRVYGEGGLSEREEQHAGRSLRADAGEGRQVVAGLRDGHAPKEGEIEPAAISLDLAQDALDAPRFDVSEAAAADGARYLAGAGAQDVLPFGEAGLELCEGAA